MNTSFDLISSNRSEFLFSLFNASKLVKNRIINIGLSTAEIDLEIDKLSNIRSKYVILDILSDFYYPLYKSDSGFTSKPISNKNVNIHSDIELVVSRIIETINKLTLIYGIENIVLIKYYPAKIFVDDNNLFQSFDKNSTSISESISRNLKLAYTIISNETNLKLLDCNIPYISDVQHQWGMGIVNYRKYNYIDLMEQIIEYFNVNCRLITQELPNSYNEETEVYNGEEFKYILRTSPDDRSLIVVFSGFTGIESPWKDYRDHYNLLNVFSNYKGNILFIRDSWGYDGSYYIMKNGDLSLQSTVSKFISKKIRNLKIPLSKCIFIGGSKGGSAAIIHGLEIGVRNIVSVCPQYFIGTRTKQYRHKTYKSMIASDSACSLIDNCVEKSIKKGNKKSSIYHIDSSHDAIEYVERNSIQESFKNHGYTNYCFINNTNSKIVDHGSVLRNSVEIIFSIIYSVKSGLRVVKI